MGPLMFSDPSFFRFLVWQSSTFILTCQLFNSLDWELDAFGCLACRCSSYDNSSRLDLYHLPSSSAKILPYLYVLPLLRLVRYKIPDRPDQSPFSCSLVIHGKYQLQSVTVSGNCARHWFALRVLMCAKVSMLCRHSSGTVCVLSALVSRWGLVARCCPGDEIKAVPRGGLRRVLTDSRRAYLRLRCSGARSGCGVSVCHPHTPFTAQLFLFLQRARLLAVESLVLYTLPGRIKCLRWAIKSECTFFFLFKDGGVIISRMHNYFICVTRAIKSTSFLILMRLLMR